MPTDSLKLMRRQLDRRLEGLKEASAPKTGWLRAIRQCLGMTAAQAGRRIGTSQQTWTQAETSEAKGTISLNTLQRYATALNCRFIYAVVPNADSIEELLLQRARKVVGQIMAKTTATMDLEDQGISEKERQQQLEEMAQDLVRDLKSNLWEDLP
jgi:predicted DNA-binding mobile mystery protein A